MRLRNLTPHPVNIVQPDGTPVATLPPDGQVARVAEETQQVDTVPVDGAEVPVLAVNFGQAQDLPEPEPEVGLIVSLKVAMAAPQRPDLYVPHGLIKDAGNRPLGSRGLTQISA